MDRAASGQNHAACSAQPYALEISLSRAEIAEKGAPGGLPASRAAECGKLPLALARTTGCNSLKRPPFRSQPRQAAIRELPDARNDRSPPKRHAKGRAGEGLVDAAWGYRRQPARAVQDRFLLAVFRPAAQGRPRALLQGQHVRAVLVGDQIPRHHGDRDPSFGVLVGGLARRHHHPRRRTRPAPRKLHRHGRAAPWRAAQDRGADVHADPSRPARDQHPQALRRMPRQSARQRRVRLGRSGLDRADHADARGAVRLPLGGPPQADALVRRRNHDSRPGRPGPDRGSADGRTRWNARPISASCGKSASTSRRRTTCCR